MTTSPIAGTSVTTSIVVAAPIDRAFSVFTDGIDSWWDREHHILEPELAEIVFEPREGGHVYERCVDGSECRWSRVLAFEPPHRFVISWDITTDWQLETDLDRTSEIEVRFVAESPDRTRVELEHRNLDRHGAGWEAMRDSVGSDGGWPKHLRDLASRIAP